MGIAVTPPAMADPLVVDAQQLAPAAAYRASDNTYFAAWIERTPSSGVGVRGVFRSARNPLAGDPPFVLQAPTAGIDRFGISIAASATQFVVAWRERPITCTERNCARVRIMSFTQPGMRPPVVTEFDAAAGALPVAACPENGAPCLVTWHRLEGAIGRSNVALAQVSEMGSAVLEPQSPCMLSEEVRTLPLLVRGPLTMGATSYLLVSLSLEPQPATPLMLSSCGILQIGTRLSSVFISRSSIGADRNSLLNLDFLPLTGLFAGERFILGYAEESSIGIAALPAVPNAPIPIPVRIPLEGRRPIRPPALSFDGQRVLTATSTIRFQPGTNEPDYRSVELLVHSIDEAGSVHGPEFVRAPSSGSGARVPVLPAFSAYGPRCNPNRLLGFSSITINATATNPISTSQVLATLVSDSDTVLCPVMDASVPIDAVVPPVDSEVPIDAPVSTPDVATTTDSSTTTVDVIAPNVRFEGGACACTTRTPTKTSAMNALFFLLAATGLLRITASSRARKRT